MVLKINLLEGGYVGLLFGKKCVQTLIGTERNVASLK